MRDTTTEGDRHAQQRQELHRHRHEAGTLHRTGSHHSGDGDVYHYPAPECDHRYAEGELQHSPRVLRSQGRDD